MDAIRTCKIGAAAAGGSEKGRAIGVGGLAIWLGLCCTWNAETLGHIGTGQSPQSSPTKKEKLRLSRGYNGTELGMLSCPDEKSNRVGLLQILLIYI